MDDSDQAPTVCADLASNREGSLTAAQRERLLAAKRGAAMSAAAWGGICGAITAGVLASHVLRRVYGDLPEPTDAQLYWFGAALIGGALATWAMVGALWRGWWRMVLDRPSPVASSEGHVRWSGRKYIARAGWRRLSSPFGPLELAPGNYRFYFIRGTGTLVSAEPLDGAAVRRENYGRVLDAASQSDLQGMAARGLSHAIGAPAVRLWKEIAWSVVVLVLFAGIWALIVFDVAPELREQLGDHPAAPILLTAVVAAVAGWMVWRIRGLWRDLTSGAVKTVEGIVTKSAEHGDDDAPQYFFHVEGVRLQVTAEAFGALIGGRRCRISYTPNSRVLVRIDPLE